MLFKHKEEVTLKPNAKQTQIKAKQIKAKQIKANRHHAHLQQ